MKRQSRSSVGNREKNAAVCHAGGSRTSTGQTRCQPLPAAQCSSGAAAGTAAWSRRRRPHARFWKPVSRWATISERTGATDALTKTPVSCRTSDDRCYTNFKWMFKSCVLIFQFRSTLSTTCRWNSTAVRRFRNVRVVPPGSLAATGHHTCHSIAVLSARCVTSPGLFRDCSRAHPGAFTSSPTLPAPHLVSILRSPYPRVCFCLVPLSEVRRYL